MNRYGGGTRGHQRFDRTRDAHVEHGSDRRDIRDRWSPAALSGRGRAVTQRMTLVHRLAVCIACLLVLAPRLVPALELGPIDARSALYEPLDARIPIRDARSGDLEGLNVVLGSPAQFELAGVARLHHLDLLEFIVVEQGDGGGYIHVRTEEPVIESSLTFLIDVDWPRGRTATMRSGAASPSSRQSCAIRSSTRSSDPGRAE